MKKFEAKYLDHVFSGKIFHAASLGRSGGVMVGVSQAIPWVSTCSVLDKEGCFVVLQENVNQCNLYIVGDYAPNKTQVPFWDTIFKILQEDLEAEVLLLGYFNATFDGLLDRSVESTTPDFPANFCSYMDC